MGKAFFFKCSSCFQVVVEGAFWGSLSNVMVGNFSNYLDKCSLVTIPLYCAVVLVGILPLSV